MNIPVHALRQRAGQAGQLYLPLAGNRLRAETDHGTLAVGTNLRGAPVFCRINPEGEWAYHHVLSSKVTGMEVVESRAYLTCEGATLCYDVESGKLLGRHEGAIKAADFGLDSVVISRGNTVQVLDPNLKPRVTREFPHQANDVYALAGGYGAAWLNNATLHFMRPDGEEIATLDPVRYDAPRVDSAGRMLVEQGLHPESRFEPGTDTRELCRFADGRLDELFDSTQLKGSFHTLKNGNLLMIEHKNKTLSILNPEGDTLAATSFPRHWRIGGFAETGEPTSLYLSTHCHPFHTLHRLDPEDPKLEDQELHSDEVSFTWLPAVSGEVIVLDKKGRTLVYQPDGSLREEGTEGLEFDRAEMAFLRRIYQEEHEENGAVVTPAQMPETGPADPLAAGPEVRTDRFGVSYQPVHGEARSLEAAGVGEHGLWREALVAADWTGDLRLTSLREGPVHTLPLGTQIGGLGIAREGLAVEGDGVRMLVPNSVSPGTESQVGVELDDEALTIGDHELPHQF